MSTTIQAPRIDIARIDRYAPAELIGREAELALLDNAWAKAVAGEPKRPHILTFVALGGEGKTSLIAKWLANQAYQGWPHCDAAFAWSFYSQGTRDQTSSSSDAFLAAALTFFGEEETANSPKHATEKAKRLAHLVGQKRTLLILDGLEPLQYPPGPPHDGHLKDEAVAALLKNLAVTSSPSLCIVTTRYSIPDLKNYRQATAPEIELQSLSSEAGVALLRHLQVHGTEQEFKRLVEDVKGHALTLNLLGAYLRDAHGGDIRRRDLVKLADAVAVEQGGHAFHVMDSYVQWLKTKSENKSLTAILRLLGLFDRPATTDCLAALWRPPAIAGLTEPLINLSEAQRNLALKRLENMKLLTVNRTSAGDLISLDAHPLVREYFARQLHDKYPEGRRAAHRRLYEHLCATTKEGDQPTLEDLQPLYQAVAHGCQAGLQQETRQKLLVDRILRGAKGGGFYTTRKLGAFSSDLGALACFFDPPWTGVSSALSEAEAASVKGLAAFNLRALGRLTEALKLMQSSLEHHVAHENWKFAAIIAGDLSELDLTLGLIKFGNIGDVKVAGALQDSEQSVTYANQSGDTDHAANNLTIRAATLHQAGQPAEAEALFREAEQMQKGGDPKYPLMFSIRGFRYCDLLLAEAERVAWHLVLSPNTQCSSLDRVASCDSVSTRAVRTLKFAEQHGGLLAIALDHLTLGRAALYEAILQGSSVSRSHSPVGAAVTGLRRAGDATRLPLALLSRAWLRLLTGARTGPDSAQEDLGEAWEIAERGPMRLHMADVHLYRARLFFRDPTYPFKNEDGSPRTPADDLAAAEQLINTCGYHRRDQELADAKAAILGK